MHTTHIRHVFGNWRGKLSATFAGSNRLREAAARRRFAIRLPLMLPLLGALLAETGTADELRLAVASNFRPVLSEAAERFEEQTGHEVMLSSGSTGKHFAQLFTGAPFDAFFAADRQSPLRLEEENRIVAGSRFSYAIGRLVLWSPQEDLVDTAGAVLSSGSFEYLAIANPELAPYGAAARQLLQSLGLWESLSGKLVRGESIGQTYQFVFSGNAELGFVARSQLSVPGHIAAGSEWEPPQELYDPIEQHAVLLRDSPAGREFMAFMRSEEVRALIRRYGYDVPDVQ